MWYTNNSNDRFGINVNESKLSIARKVVFTPPFIKYPKRKYDPQTKLQAGYHITQIDDEYIGAFNGSYLLMDRPTTHQGVKIDPKLIKNASYTKDSYTFYYPSESGGLIVCSGRIDQDGIRSEYNFNDIRNKVVRTDLRADADRMKEQEQKLNSMYFQFVTLANNLAKQGFSKNKIKEDLYFRILNLVQTGQIDEQTGMTLNSWLGKLESLDTRSVEEKAEAVFNDLNNKIDDPKISKNDLLTEIDNSILTEQQKRDLKFNLEQHPKTS